MWVQEDPGAEAAPLQQKRSVVSEEREVRLEDQKERARSSRGGCQADERPGVRGPRSLTGSVSLRPNAAVEVVTQRSPTYRTRLRKPPTQT